MPCAHPLAGFLSFDDLTSRQGELALSLEYEPFTQDLSIIACAPLPIEPTQQDVAATYVSLCDSEDSSLFNFFSTPDHAVKP